MKDDYLWDRSGETDPEVDRLEKVLRSYRYQPRPASPELISRLPRPEHPARRSWMKLAAAAAAILLLALGLWIIRGRYTRVETPTSAQNNHDAPSERDVVPLPNRSVPTPPIKPPEPDRRLAVTAPRRSEPANRLPRPVRDPDSDLRAERQPIFIPFVDVATARHLEQAQLVLRSFRNTRDSDLESDDDLAYEKQCSRGLLLKNVLLRRDAEAKGNQPVEELLGSLEPFLIDIANLPDKPSRDQVQSIKDQMNRKEILPALQIYAAPTLSQAF